MLKIFPHIENAQKSSINFRVILQLKDAHSAKKNIAIILKKPVDVAGGIHHICIEVNNIDAAVQQMKVRWGPIKLFTSKKTILLYSHLSNTLFVPFIFILTFVA